MAFWVLLITASLLLSLASRRKVIYVNDASKIFMSLCLFSCYAFIQAVLRPPLFNLNQTVNCVILYPAFAFLGFISALNKKSVIKCLLFIGAIYLLILVEGYWTGWFKLDAMQWQKIAPDIYESRPDTTNNGYQTINVELSVFFLLLFFWSIPKQRLFFSWLLRLPLLLITAVFIAAVGGRGGPVGLVATVFLLCSFLVIKFIKAKPLTYTDKNIIVISLLLFLGVAIFFLFLNDSLFVTRILRVTDNDDSTSRLYLFSSGVQAWLTSAVSVIFGIGPQHFPVAAGYYREGYYPHNFLLEVLCEYGIIGLLLLAYPFYTIFKNFINHTLFQSHESDNDIALFSIFLLYFFAWMVSGALALLWPLVYLGCATLPVQYPLYSNQQAFPFKRNTRACCNG